MTKIESYVHYLHDASVARLANGGQLAVGCPTAKGAFPPEGEWMIATRAFWLPGLRGDPGADVTAGQRFRLSRAGSPEEASIWEIA